MVSKKSINMLVAYSSSFSGSTQKLISALKNTGIKITEEKISLRVLPLRIIYIFYMYVNSLIVYGKGFNQFINKTFTSFQSKSKAYDFLLSKHKEIDVVLQIQANCIFTSNPENNKKINVIFTDHTNMLSKKLPDFGFDVPEKKIDKSWNEIEKNIFEAHDCIFVMGSHVKESVINDYGIESKKIVVTGCGPNLDLDIERDKIEKNYYKKNILFVGIDAKRKGLEVLINAFEIVVKKYQDAVLNIVGVFGKSTSNIKYHGKLNGDKLKMLYYSCQVFVLPSFREPFGIVFIEAMYSKNVCIGTNIEAIPELIGEIGYMIEPNDSHGLSETLITVFSDPVKMQYTAETAYAMAKKRWSWSIVATIIKEKIVHMQNFRKIASS